MPEEAKSVCPKCGSTLIQPVTNALRCGQCGAQFAEVRSPVAVVSRYPESGFRPHVHGR